jgi:hypothetical protein
VAVQLLESSHRQLETEISPYSCVVMYFQPANLLKSHRNLRELAFADKGFLIIISSSFMHDHIEEFVAYTRRNNI